MRRIIEFLKSSLQEGPRAEVETAVRSVLRAYQDRSSLPEVWVYVSTDLQPPGMTQDRWASDEARHFTLLVQQWADDHGVRSVRPVVEFWPLETGSRIVHVRLVDPAVGRRVAGKIRSLRHARIEERHPVLRRSDTDEVIAVDSPLIVGRAPGVDILLDDPKVSRQHARIARDTDGLFIEDLESSNGTEVNGAKIDSGARASLSAGDSIRFGPFTLSVESG